jgi:hypothetical protein
VAQGAPFQICVLPLQSPPPSAKARGLKQLFFSVVVQISKAEEFGMICGTRTGASKGAHASQNEKLPRKNAVGKKSETQQRK